MLKTYTCFVSLIALFALSQPSHAFTQLSVSDVQQAIDNNPYWTESAPLSSTEINGNPYIKMSNAKLAGEAAVVLSALVASCNGGLALSLVVDVTTLIPLVGGIAPDSFHTTDGRDGNERFPWFAAGIAAPVMETLGAACRTVYTGFKSLGECFSGNRVESVTTEDFFDYSGTWAIIKSWGASFDKFAGNPDSLCGQQAQKLKLINEAISLRMKKK